MNFNQIETDHALMACPCCAMPAQMFRCVPDKGDSERNPSYLVSCTNATVENDIQYEDPACAFNTSDLARAKATMREAAELWNKIAKTLVQTRRMASGGTGQMQTFKYVVVKTDEQGLQLFMFPKEIDHDRFAEVTSFIKHNVNGDPRNWERIFREPVSAGFTDGLTCWGRSETLDLSCIPEQDNALLRGTEPKWRSSK